MIDLRKLPCHLTGAQEAPEEAMEWLDWCEDVMEFHDVFNEAPNVTPENREDGLECLTVFEICSSLVLTLSFSPW